MDFLNHREGVWLSIRFPLFFPLQCTVTELEIVRGCVSLMKLKSQGKAVEMTVNSKEENFSDFCPDFVQEFVLCNASWI
jgi:hypothetical protein